MITQIQNVTDYLKTYGTLLAEKVKQRAEPLFMPGDPWDPKMETPLRKPFAAQGDVIQALVKTFEDQNSAAVVGEMGVGKSIIAGAIPYIAVNGRRPLQSPYHVPQSPSQKMGQRNNEHHPKGTGTDYQKPQRYPGD